MRRGSTFVVGALALTLASTSAAVAQEPEAWTQSDVLSGSRPDGRPADGSTPGPNGEESVNAADIADPTAECLAQVKGLKLAFLNGLAGNTWMGAIEAGVRAKAAEYGIEVVATASSDFDPAKEATAVETLMASDPDILVTIPVDPTAGAANYKPALDAGTTLVFYDNPVDGWTGGKEYVAIVTGDHYRMGKDAADLLAQAIGEEGTYGFIQLDVPFYNSNNREKGFLAEMAQAHPGSRTWRGPGSPRTPRSGADHGRDAPPASRPRRHLRLLQRWPRHGRAGVARGRRQHHDQGRDPRSRRGQ